MIYKCAQKVAQIFSDAFDFCPGGRAHASGSPAPRWAATSAFPPLQVGARTADWGEEPVINGQFSVSESIAIACQPGGRHTN